jgi:hypothetical protein
MRLVKTLIISLFISYTICDHFAITATDGNIYTFKQTKKSKFIINVIMELEGPLKAKNPQESFIQTYGKYSIIAVANVGKRMYLVFSEKDIASMESISPKTINYIDDKRTKKMSLENFIGFFRDGKVLILNQEKIQSLYDYLKTPLSANIIDWIHQQQVLEKQTQLNEAVKALALNQKSIMNKLGIKELHPQPNLTVQIEQQDPVTLQQPLPAINVNPPSDTVNQNIQGSINQPIGNQNTEVSVNSSFGVIQTIPVPTTQSNPSQVNQNTPPVSLSTSDAIVHAMAELTVNTPTTEIKPVNQFLNPTPTAPSITQPNPGNLENSNLNSVSLQVTPNPPQSVSPNKVESTVTTNNGNNNISLIKK